MIPLDCKPLLSFGCNCDTVPSICLQSAGSLANTQIKSEEMPKIHTNVIVHCVNDLTDH